jgi:Histidine kinase-, DNA gyrase B-, and HSP90-like ATPase
MSKPGEAVVGRPSARSFEVPPSAARLTSSLRDIGYDFPTAVADLVDNSIAAGATRVDIELVFDGPQSYVSIADDGSGMTANGLLEAMRFGTRREYGLSDLGRYGLGLKTAPLSQCRSVTVVTRRSLVNRLITRRTLDLDLVERWDSWMIVEAAPTAPVEQAIDRLQDGPGTVVIWEKLDRVLPEKNVDGGWAKRRLLTHASRLTQHLGMVFHRFIEGTAGRASLTISVNGEKVEPWNPFATAEPSTQHLPVQSFEIKIGEVSGEVSLRPYVLPSRDRFSSPSEFERLSGPLKWNRQQGLYAYRADRLVQWGGWNGLRAIDEHTKLARAALEFNTDLDSVFHINVAKMRIAVPSELRQMLERPVHELCIRAGEAYRKAGRPGHRESAGTTAKSAPTFAAGIALSSAAMELGHMSALREIVELLRGRDPELVKALGLA